MQSRPLGATGITVPLLGLGAGHIGGQGQSEGEIERLLRGAVDLGVTLFDTAPGYGVGTSRLAHVARASALVERGPLPEGHVAAIRAHFAERGGGFRGEG